jgi:hypothetical protein
VDDTPAANRQLLALQQEVQQLHAERCSLTNALQRLQQQRAQLLEENHRLKSALATLTARGVAEQPQGAALLPSPSPSGSTRELRKLRYEATKLAGCVARQETELQRLRSLVQLHTVKSIPAAVPEREANSLPPLAPPAPGVTLQGKKVAVIGGFGKATLHYEHIIQELGGGYLSHDGDLRRGYKSLVDIVKQADVVVCPVDCNSHGATTCAKRLCKAMHKPCYFLRSSGVTHVREKLLEIAEMGGEPGGRRP